MKIVVAMDSFKNCLTAGRACEIVAKAVDSAVSGLDIVIKPMADGGEGTVKAMLMACGGQWIEKTVTGPLPDMRVKAGFAMLGNGEEAVVEMAAASGLELLEPAMRNPMKTTTYGTGELIAAATDCGADKILLGIGGSATVDGGVGAAMAMGWKFLDAGGNEIGLGGGELIKIAKIIPPEAQSGKAAVEVMCDVNNPLCGENGAAKIYGPQKGATEEMVDQLERGLGNLADVVERELGHNIKDVAGAGAAGGLGGGAIAFMSAKLVSGIEAVMSQSRLAEEIEGAGWVLTGEGIFDGQSLRGKVVSGIMEMSKKFGAKVGVLAGQVSLNRDDYKKFGVSDAIECKGEDMSLQYAIDNSEKLLGGAAREFAIRHFR